MYGLIAALSGVLLGKEIIQEKLKKPAPANQRFDWDKYNEDCRDLSLDPMEVVKRRGNGYYYTTAPLPQLRYQNRMKQAMWEQYQRDLKENPDWAAFKIRHGNYGGFVFDDTES